MELQCADLTRRQCQEVAVRCCQRIILAETNGQFRSAAEVEDICFACGFTPAVFEEALAGIHTISRQVVNGQALIRWAMYRGRSGQPILPPELRGSDDAERAIDVEGVDQGSC